MYVVATNWVEVKYRGFFFFFLQDLKKIIIYLLEREERESKSRIEGQRKRDKQGSISGCGDQVPS